MAATRHWSTADRHVYGGVSAPGLEDRPLPPLWMNRQLLHWRTGDGRAAAVAWPMQAEPLGQRGTTSRK